MNTRNALAALSIIGLAGFASPTFAANYTLNWLDHSPVTFGTQVPNNSNYFLPGIGNVNITYSMPTSFVQSRTQNGFFIPGSVTSGPDTYSWTTHEMFGMTSLAPPQPTLSQSWNITYTFPGVVPAGTLILGVAGLGSTTSFGGGDTTATVLQNGQFLGDFVSAGNYGATQFNGGPGVFSMQNSVTGAGGQDPWWNTQLGLVTIMDPVSSLTIRVNQLSGDGIGLNIASIVPTPGAGALAGVAGLLTLRRRRRT
ncbi:MAG TPA: hypothetical protein VG797_03160 [Phycisphaerales bacterium]|nr:hypothetical protein [Phycisphaerales bacterium]